ncbi:MULTISPECIES: hypothetical protein [unclassified Streptomyces]|uniref:hypothetical protein n=1 Tax=unclassified Streptomyces TaxID=2593676 RepID=UPI002E11523B|nr:MULTISPECIES: hypothetical protein [unclassified Streptomyces]WSR27471.1 hypothetical protein OG573_15835 [Streptomyces sp. NBC_01205]
MIGRAYEEHGSGGGTVDPTATPAATGLFLLAVGGWLLNTARPWHKPGHPVILGLGWAVALTLLLWGLVLLARCVRTVHGAAEPAPYEGSGDDGADRTGETPARPAS